MKRLLCTFFLFVSLVFTSETKAFEIVQNLPVDGNSTYFERYLTTKASGLFYAPQSVQKTAEGYYEVLSMVEYSKPNSSGVKRVVIDQYLGEEYYLVSRMIGYAEDNQVLYYKYIESPKWNYISPQDTASMLFYLAKENFEKISK